MSFTEFLNEMANMDDSGKRTLESVSDAILEVLADFMPISGGAGSHQGLIKITRAHAADSEFAKAVEVIAKKALEIFPVETAPVQATERPVTTENVTVGESVASENAMDQGSSLMGQTSEALESASAPVVN